MVQSDYSGELESRSRRSGRSGVSFVVEALVLLVFLAACMAVFTQLFSGSSTLAANSERLSNAIMVAKDAAEEFSSAPQAVASGEPVGLTVIANGKNGFAVTCDVTDDKTEAGTMYHAHITVSDEEGTAYELDASRYVSGVE